MHGRNDHVSEEKRVLPKATTRLFFLASPHQFQRLTAISGLSANTYSCGGEGERVGGGDGDSSLKYLVMGGVASKSSDISSSVVGTDDNEDISESDSDMIAHGGLGGVWGWTSLGCNSLGMGKVQRRWTNFYSSAAIIRSASNVSDIL